MRSLDFIDRAAIPRAGRLGIAFGLERFAFIPFRAPTVTILVALAIAVLAILGIQRIKTDDSLSQLFRSEDPAFKQFEQISRQFPSSEYDVLIVLSGQTLLARELVDKLGSLVTDVQLIDGTRGVLSMFSARQPAPEGGLPEPLFPDPLPEGSAYHALMDRVKDNPIIRGKLLSDDGRLAVAILSLEPSAVDGGKLDAVVNDIRRTADEDLQGTGLKAELTGVPVMQLEIRHALERDRILYNAVGFALGCGIAGLFFRRLSLMLVAAGPPLLAIVFALGALGWLGFRLNMFLNVMTPLIMVISFSDSMQLTFAARDQLMAGKDKRTAFRNAILHRRTGVRPHPRRGGPVLARSAHLVKRPHSRLRRSGILVDRHRARHNALARSRIRRAADPRRGAPGRDFEGCGSRRGDAPPFLRLDRRAHGQPSGPF